MTLVEVMLALFMIGTVLTTLFVLESTIFNKVADYSTKIGRIFLLKERLFKAHFERAQRIKAQDKKQEETTNNVTISYELKKPSKDSVLKKFDGIMIEQVTASWDEFGVQQKETMINLVYKPEKKE